MRLYKYLSPKLTTILENQMVRFSQPSVLNDPFELKPHISSVMSKEDMVILLEELLPNIISEEYNKLSSFEKSLLPYKPFEKSMTTMITSSEALMLKTLTDATPLISEKIFEGMDRSLGIFCLSEKRDNELMWSHYADSHQGFVVEFDSDSAFFNQKKTDVDEFRYMRKVEYSDHRPSITLNKIEDFTPFLTKGSQWSYEAEWRIMFALADATQVIEQPQSNIYLFQFPADALRSITFGHRMNDSKRNEIIEIIKSTPQFKHVSFHEAVIGSRDYRIHISDL